MPLQCRPTLDEQHYAKYMMSEIDCRGFCTSCGASALPVSETMP